MIERVGQQPLSTVHSQRQETSSPGASFDAALRQQMQAQESQVGLVEHPAKLRVLLGGQEELRVGGDHIVEFVLLQQLPPPLGGLLPGQVVKGDP